VDGEEIFVPDFRKLMDELVDKAIKESQCVPGFMKKREKLAVLQVLETRGVFLMKGAVREVAARLGIAAPTIYKYLNEHRNSGRSKVSGRAVSQQER